LLTGRRPQLLSPATPPIACAQPFLVAQPTGLLTLIGPTTFLTLIGQTTFLTLIGQTTFLTLIGVNQHQQMSPG
jgi:hypothetical protein